MNNNGAPRLTFRQKFENFMQGRNGIDRFYYFILAVIFIITLLNLWIGSWALYVVDVLIFAFSLFRVFSKNVYRRQKENQFYLNCEGKVKSFFRNLKKNIKNLISLSKNRWRDRKTHVYKKCPKCKNILRLPKVKGHHTAACPCCENRFDVKI